MPQQASSRDSWVELDLPQAISIGVRQLARSAGWQVEQRGGTWRACTRENYLKQKPNLLGIRPVDAPGLRPGTGYEILGTLMDQEHLTVPAMRVLVERELTRLEGLGDSDIPALLARFQLLFTNTPTSALPAAMRSFFENVAREHIPGSTLFMIDLAPELSARYTLVRALLTAYVWPSIGELPAGRATAPVVFSAPSRWSTRPSLSWHLIFAGSSHQGPGPPASGSSGARLPGQHGQAISS